MTNVYGTSVAMKIGPHHYIPLPWYINRMQFPRAKVFTPEPPPPVPAQSLVTSTHCTVPPHGRYQPFITMSRHD